MLDSDGAVALVSIQQFFDAHGGNATLQGTRFQSAQARCFAHTQVFTACLAQLTQQQQRLAIELDIGTIAIDQHAAARHSTRQLLRHELCA